MAIGTLYVTSICRTELFPLTGLVRLDVDTLPARPWVCYKPEMRKWMSERLKRRKKEPEKAGSEPAPAPLQPAFYDTQPPHSEAPPERDEPSAAPLHPEASQNVPSSEARAATEGQSASGDPSKRRRRRGRGGRGRGRNAAPPAQAIPSVEPQGSTQPTSREAMSRSVEAPA